MEDGVGKRIWILGVLVSYFLITGATFIGGGGSSGGGTPGGLNTQLQFHNAGTFGGLTAVAASNSATFPLAISALETDADGPSGVLIKDTSYVGTGKIWGAPPLLSLANHNESNFYMLGYSIDGGTHEVANYLTADGHLVFDFVLGGASLGGSVALSSSGFKVNGATGISVTCSVMPTAMTITGGIITSVTGGTCS